LKPLIGITVGPRDEGSPYVQTRSSYVHAVEVAGGLPVLIPPVGPDALEALLERLDGIMFPGGADVDPAEYGEVRQPKTEVVSELDRLELAVAHWAVQSDIPTLGICRGQQVLNVALGGSLIQHLDDHRQPGDRTALTQTLILPSDDGGLAARLLEEVVHDRVMAIFVVLGGNDDLVRRADRRAQPYPGIRHVVWVRNPALPEIAPWMNAFRGGDPRTIAVVLSLTDRIVARFTTAAPIDNIAIEAAFFKAMSAGSIQ
jgi:hypothetical protein